MSDFPPPANGTEQRLEAVLDRLDRLVALHTPQPAADAPADGETIELTEPAATPKRAKR